MLLHLDGSVHRWFDHRLDERQTLLAVIEDATKERQSTLALPLRHPPTSALGLLSSRALSSG
jgi:hypothetical protein